MKVSDLSNTIRILESIDFNIENNLNIIDCQFRPGSKMFDEYFKYISENRKKYQLDEIDQMMLDNGLGQTAECDGERVSLGIPFIDLDEKKKPTEYECWVGYKKVGTKIKNGKKVNDCVKETELNEAPEGVKLNEPQRGGSKKYFVYVKDPKTGKIKKVSFGAKDGGPELKVKFNNPERRAAFASRHKCSEKTDITTPGYWSCNLPKYADKLGLKGGGNFFW